MNKEINLALKHRTEEMLKGNYSKNYQKKKFIQLYVN